MRFLRTGAWALLLGASGLYGAGAPPELPPPPSLAGTWQYVPGRSTSLTPWQSLVMRIAIDGNRVTITDQFAAGTRTIGTTQAFDLSRPVNRVPVPFWADNRSIGATIGGDHTEQLRARWLDGGRILRTDADLVLDVQQGPRQVNILTDYKISPEGDELAMAQLRSTREIPILYVFKRIHP